MWFESLLVFILFKFKKRPNISGIVNTVYICMSEKMCRKEWQRNSYTAYTVKQNCFLKVYNNFIINKLHLRTNLTSYLAHFFSPTNEQTNYSQTIKLSYGKKHTDWKPVGDTESQE